MYKGTSINICRSGIERPSFCCEKIWNSCIPFSWYMLSWTFWRPHQCNEFQKKSVFFEFQKFYCTKTNYLLKSVFPQTFWSLFLSVSSLWRGRTNRVHGCEEAGKFKVNRAGCSWKLKKNWCWSSGLQVSCSGEVSLPFYSSCRFCRSCRSMEGHLLYSVPRIQVLLSSKDIFSETDKILFNQICECCCPGWSDI